MFTQGGALSGNDGDFGRISLSAMVFFVLHFLIIALKTKPPKLHAQAKTSAWKHINRQSTQHQVRKMFVT